MKRLLALILSLVMCVSLLAGCGNKAEKDDDGSKDGMGASISSELKEKQKNSDTLLSNDEIQYVMIYNPNIFNETESFNELLNTGDIGSYIEAVSSRAGELSEPTSEIIPRSFEETNGGLDLGSIEIEPSNRAGGFAPTYSTGDTQEFYCGTDSRSKQTFNCLYVGDSCYIWSQGSAITSEQAEDVGKEFDEKIFDKCVNIFGESRFVADGGKVNLLFYPMEQGLGGFAYGLDCFATGEIPEELATERLMNLDHDILNINSIYVGREELIESIYSTMAHEYQHLVCFADFFNTPDATLIGTWINEAMSGYIEEVIYPGSKDLSGHYDAFAESTRIRHGQSMYNFETTTNPDEWDIGVYGSVYLFSEYLASTAGDDIYSKIHSYWRDSYSDTLCDSEAIVKSVPEAMYTYIDNSVDFEDAFSFKNETDEWLSKLTLNFYLSLLKYDKDDPEAFKKVESQTLLYDEINPADIEGGGRVIAALKDGTFKFPEDADEGLIYVGLNKDFEVVTDYVIR